jgi:ABC-type uncharacterized transport system.
LRREDGAKGGNNMKKINIGKSFQQKKFKYGGYATMLTIIVFAIVVAINLVVGQLNLKLDLSKNKLYSLSDQSVKIVSGIKKDVTIYAVYQSGKEDPTTNELLKKYAAKSKNIKISYIDPVLHPEKLTKYKTAGATIDAGSLIVESGNRNKTILYSDMVNSSSDGSSVQSYAGEQKITSAIMYVTSTTNPVVYSLQGHSEVALPTELTKALSDQNFTEKDLNLFSDQWNPQSGDVLLINSPQKDITADELTKIKAFLTKGGRGIFLVDLVKEDRPNLNQLLSNYGVSIPKAVILEGNSSNAVANNPQYLIPTLQSHDIVNPLSSAKEPVVMGYAQPISEVKPKRDTLKIEALLTTSDKAYGKTNLDSQTAEKEKNDLSGPFNIAVAVTDTVDSSDTTKNAKLVIFSSSSLLNSQFIAATNGGNLDMMMNSLNWLSERKDNISVLPKDVTATTLTMNGTEQMTVAAIAVIIIPLAIAAIGVVVWIRRRHL